MEVRAYESPSAAKPRPFPKLAGALLGVATLLPGCIRFGEPEQLSADSSESTSRQEIKLDHSTLPVITPADIKSDQMPSSRSSIQEEESTPRILRGRGLDQKIAEVQVSEVEYRGYAFKNSPVDSTVDLTETYFQKHLTPSDPIVKRLAELLSSGAKSKEHAANHLLTWVRENITYAKDQKDYHQYPVETLYLGQGDGEDAAYLYTSMLQSIGIESLLVRLNDHIAVGVAGDFSGSHYHTRGKEFFFAEPAANSELTAKVGFKVGVAPTKYEDQDAKLYESEVDAIFQFNDAMKKRWEMQIPHQILNRYAAQTTQRCCAPLYDAEGHWAFVTEDDPTIRMIAEKITNGLSSNEDKAQALLDFVHEHVQYRRDPEHNLISDYWQFPVETISERLGDCEDSSYLYASLCRSLGIECCLITFEGHIAVGVAGKFAGCKVQKDGTTYYLAETTDDGALIGEYSDKESTTCYVLTRPKDSPDSPMTVAQNSSP